MGASTLTFAAPVFNPFAISLLPDDNVPNPACVDIDGDGDLDLFIGCNIGNILFLRADRKLDSLGSSSADGTYGSAA